MAKKSERPFERIVASDGLLYHNSYRKSHIGKRNGIVPSMKDMICRNRDGGKESLCYPGFASAAIVLHDIGAVLYQ